MQVNVTWYVTAGDYVGISCNGYCPVRKDPEYPFRSLVSLNGGSTTNYQNDMLVAFNDEPLNSLLAIQVIIGKLGSQGQLPNTNYLYR